jgi:UDP-N-acetylmuramate: L-alanyl-gamma-D-glutamyl-meso-diaminopimelate ligase
LRTAGRTADHIVEPAEIARRVAATAESGDVVLIMSNGGFGGVHARLLDRLAIRFGSEAAESA